MTTTGQGARVTPTDLPAQDLLGAVPDGLWMFDDEGRTTFANEHLAGLLGVPLVEMPGRSVLDFLDAQGRADVRRHLLQRRSQVSTGRNLAWRLVRPDGSTTWTLVSHSPVRVDGEVRGHLFRVKDHAEQRALLEELQKRDTQFAEVQSLARIGSWERDLDSSVVTWSEETYRLCGLDRETFVPDVHNFVELVHPEDGLVLAEQYQAMLDGGPPLDVEVRLAGPGEVSWLRVRGVITSDATGQPVRVGGTMQDITESKRHAEGLEFLAELSGAANRVESLAELFFSVDRDIRLHSGWRALMASGPHYKDPTRPFFAPMQEMSDELCRVAEELAQAVFDTRRTTTALSPHGTVLLAGPAMVGDELACTIVSDTGGAAPPSRADLALYDQMLHHLAQVAARERTAQDLAAARDEALMASRAKTEFLATMSHEIRTPLNGVIGLSELLRHTELSPEQARLASGVDQAGRSLLALVNDILDLSKIEAGRLELEEVDFELRPVVAQSVGLVTDRAREKGLEVTVTYDPTVPQVVRGDPVRLGQVVTNLASNAVKFTASGTVSVRASWADGLLRVEVQDTGIGISPQARDKLFRPFTQADSSTTRTYGGTGLGLAISSRIVAATGGAIGVDTSLPVGSRFWFTMQLPAAELPVLLAEARDAEPEPAAGAGGTGRTAGRVLVVEDNAINQLVAEGMLHRLGYDVVMAGNGSACVSWLAAEPEGFDAILMDCQMPVMDGFDATRAVRALQSEGRRTPIIAMTAAALTAERERCFEAGMDDFLTKPVDPARLEAVLARWVPRRERAAVPAPPPAAEPAPPDDRDEVAARLGDLDAMGVDHALLVQIVDAFDEVARTALAGMDHGAASGAAQAVAQQAHSLRGAASNLGLAGLAELCLALESSARDGVLPSAATLEAVRGATLTGRELLADFLRSRG